MESFDLNLLIRPNGLLLVRDARRVGAERLVSAAHRDGDLVRLRKGIYIPRPVWEAMSPDDRYRRRIDAAALALSKDAVFSHYSAACLWGLQIVGPGHRRCIPSRAAIVEDGRLLASSGTRLRAR